MLNDNAEILLPPGVPTDTLSITTNFGLMDSFKEKRYYKLLVKEHQSQFEALKKEETGLRQAIEQCGKAGNLMLAIEACNNKLDENLKKQQDLIKKIETFIGKINEAKRDINRYLRASIGEVMMRDMSDKGCMTPIDKEYYERLLPHLIALRENEHSIASNGKKESPIPSHYSVLNSAKSQEGPVDKKDNDPTPNMTLS